MHKRRLSIAKLMVIVGVLAVNLDVLRLIHAIDRARLPAVIASGLVLQSGLLGLVRGRRHARVFWLGFVLADALVIASLLSPASRYWTAWYQYFLFAGDRIQVFPEFSRFVKSDYRVFVAAFALIISLPQLVISLAGGLLAMFVVHAFEERAALTSTDKAR